MAIQLIQNVKLMNESTVYTPHIIMLKDSKTPIL